MRVSEKITATLEYVAACPCGYDAMWYVTLVSLYDDHALYAPRLIEHQTRYDVQCDACLAREEVLLGAA